MRGWLAIAFILCLAARSFAQPAAPPTQADYARATELFSAGTQALNDGRVDDAVRDFLAAFDITKDPVVLFKVGLAYEKGGKCTDAITYYQRYLAEAKPAENFVTLTNERIDACKAILAAAQPEPAPEPPKPVAPPAATPAEAPAETPAAPLAQPSVNKDRAWLFVGGSLAFVTAGAVLAYSSHSAEQDIKDLYVSNNGNPPEFDAKTKERYDELVDEGNRYKYLAWTSFGLAAGCAIGATIFFLRDRNDVSVTPVVTPKETGVSATLRF